MRLFALLAIVGCLANAQCILSCSVEVSAGHGAQASSSQHNCCKSHQPAESQQSRQLCPDPSPNLIASMLPANDAPVLQQVDTVWLGQFVNGAGHASHVQDNQERWRWVGQSPASLQRRPLQLLRV